MNSFFALVSKAATLFMATLIAFSTSMAFAQKSSSAPTTQAAVNNPFNMLKADLKITSTQEAAWQSYVSSITRDFQPSQTLTIEQFNAMKTPDRVAFLKKLHTEHNNFLLGRFDASVALYNALDANQKKTFDDMTAERAPQQQAPAAAKGKTSSSKKK